jgi:hypothetical protein
VAPVQLNLPPTRILINTQRKPRDIAASGDTFRVIGQLRIHNSTSIVCRQTKTRASSSNWALAITRSAVPERVNRTRPEPQRTIQHSRLFQAQQFSSRLCHRTFQWEAEREYVEEFTIPAVYSAAQIRPDNTYKDIIPSHHIYI